MAIYTYVVDHGEDSPRVGLKSLVNGYPIKAVSFGDQLDKNEKARGLIEGVLLDVDQSSFESLEQALKLI